MQSAEKPSSSQPAPAGEPKNVFVRRLARLIQLRRNFLDDMNPTGRKMLELSIYATYRDCIDFGVADEARLLLTRAGLRSAPSPGSGPGLSRET